MNAGRFGRDNSSGPDLTSHFSVSLDYGSDPPLSADQISFNSLKEKIELVASGDERFKVSGTAEESEASVHGALSYQEAIGKASYFVSCSCRIYARLPVIIFSFLSTGKI